MREEIVSLIFVENENLKKFQGEINIIFHSFIKGILEKELEKAVTEKSYEGFVIVARFMHNQQVLEKIFPSGELVGKIRGEIADIRSKNIIFDKEDLHEEEHVYEVNYITGKVKNGVETLQYSQNKVKGRVVITDQDSFAKSKKMINKEAKNKDIFYINIYLNCQEFVSHLNRENMGHVVISKKDQDTSCYSEILDLFSVKKGRCDFLFAKTITKITYKTLKNSRDSNRYIPEEEYYYMRKFIIGEEVELADDSIAIWLNAFLYSPMMCFSYGEDEGIHDVLSEINSSILKYLPFADFYKDKKESNMFRRLKDVIDVIKIADIVVAIINKQYLESFYAMDEIFDLYEKHKAAYDTYQYIGLIPYVRDDAREIIFRNKDIKTIKDNFSQYRTSDQLNDEQKAKASKIYDSFDKIIEFLKTVYNHLPERDHRETGYRALAWAIYRHLIDHVECDVYDDIRNYEDFPKLKM